MNRPETIPPGAIAVKSKISDAVAYLFETSGRPCAVGFAGRSQKPRFAYRFQSQSAREAHVKTFFHNYDARATRKAEERSKPHDFKPGDILYSAWGYEQTNVNFYEVISATARTVTVLELATETTVNDGYGEMAGRATPVLGRYISEKMRSFVSSGYAKIAGCELARLWDGKPVPWSSCH